MPAANMNTSKLVRLEKISDSLDPVIRFAYDYENDRRSVPGTLAKVGALAGTGVAGTLAHQAIRSSGGYGANWNQAKQSFKTGRDVLGEATGNVPKFGNVAGGLARGAGTQWKMALGKLKALARLSSRSDTIELDEKILEPFAGGSPNSKITQEQFPAGLGPAQVLKFPFPKLMRYLNRPNQLQQQFSKLGKLTKLNSRLGEIQFGNDDTYQKRPFQRAYLGPGFTTAIHAPRGQKLKGFLHTQGRAVGETLAGSAAGTGIGAGVGAGIGALAGAKGGKAQAAKMGASAGALIGNQVGTVGGALHGIYGKRATDLYKRYTNQENLSLLLDGLIEFSDPAKKKISGRQLKR